MALWNVEYTTTQYGVYTRQDPVHHPSASKSKAETNVCVYPVRSSLRAWKTPASHLCKGASTRVNNPIIRQLRLSGRATSNFYAVYTRWV